MSLRYKRPPAFGVNGGHDAGNGGIWIWEPRGEEFRGLTSTAPDAYADATPVAGVLDPETNLPSPGGEFCYFLRVPSWHTRPMSLLRYVTSGGGGFGNPLEREPERVKRDVRDGYVTIEGAARDYGVIVTGATERLRASLRAP
jgi:N-methylhydantoinase B